MRFNPKPVIDADALVTDIRERYPDLTEEEEAQVRHAAQTGACLFLRCYFKSNPNGVRFGETPLITIDEEI